MSLLRLDLVANLRLQTEPFAWGLLTQTFASTADAQWLQRTFPAEGFRQISSEYGEKRYQMCGRALDVDDAAPWPALGEELRSDAYRSALEACTGLDLSTSSVELSLWRQSRGSFLSPHTDKADKVLTHILFFGNDDWCADDGGFLRILRSSDDDDVATLVAPRLEHSVVLVRSDRSWHGVGEVLSIRQDRCSLQVVFHRSGLRYTSSFGAVPASRNEVT